MPHQKQMLCHLYKNNNNKSHIFSPTSLFPNSTVLHISLSISLSSSSHPCFFHCCVSPTELLWAHTVPSATDLLHSRAMFIKETRESASYGLSHITYSIPPEAGARHQSKHTEKPLTVAYELSLPRCKDGRVFIWDRWINFKKSNKSAAFNIQ